MMVPSSTPTVISTSTPAPIRTHTAIRVSGGDADHTDRDGDQLTHCHPSPPGCPGDCSADHMVTVDELIECVRMSLGMLDVEQCRAFDRNGDGRITIEELIAAVQAALGGC